MKRAREEPAPTTSGASAGASSSSMHSRAYVGVYRTRDGQHWRAWIGFGGRHHTVGGRFDNESLAARAYDAAAMLLFGPRAAVNFGAGHARAFIDCLNDDPGFRALEQLKMASDTAAFAAPAVAGAADGAPGLVVAPPPARESSSCSQCASDSAASFGTPPGGAAPRRRRPSDGARSGGGPPRGAPARARRAPGSYAGSYAAAAAAAVAAMGYLGPCAGALSGGLPLDPLLVSAAAGAAGAARRDAWCGLEAQGSGPADGPACAAQPLPQALPPPLLQHADGSGVSCWASGNWAAQAAAAAADAAACTSAPALDAPALDPLLCAGPCDWEPAALPPAAFGAAPDASADDGCLAAAELYMSWTGMDAAGDAAAPLVGGACGF